MKYLPLLTMTSLLVALGCDDPLEVAGPPTTPDAGDAAMDTTTSPPIVEADPPPPAISGGSLLVTRDDAFAVAADPELDRIFVVDLATLSLKHTIELERGDEPGRLVDDDAGRVHVALRRGGAVVSIDPMTGELLERRSVCAAPRGIAHRASDDTLVVACSEGKIVFLPANAGEPTGEATPATDLRDVVVLESGELMVSRFRSAEVLVLSPDATSVSNTITLPITATSRADRTPRPGDDLVLGVPAVAWRMIASRTGSLVLHQRATSGVVEVDPRTPGGYGGSGGSSCDSPPVVQTVATFVQPDGVTSTIGALERLVLGVDVALSPDSAQFAVAAPAMKNSRGLRAGRDDILLYSSARPDLGALVDEPSAFEPSVQAPPTTPSDPCIAPEESIFTPDVGVSVAVAFDSNGRLVALTQSPARLVVVDGSAPEVVLLSDDDRFDIGHSIFHSATLGGIACASCHPEGGDDGRVWFFSDVGERRTQAFAGALLGTEPFHWSGDMESFERLAHVVFEGRMQGALLTPDEIQSFARWLDTLEPPPRPEPDDPAAVERGRELFTSTEVGCATCHAGPQLTTAQTVFVGTSGMYQVPSLVGVHYRAPYMHDGCAEDLRARLTDADCGGGELHGHTAHLSDAQIDDLIAYLSTL